MDEDVLFQQFTDEIKALTLSGAILPLEFTPHQAFTLLSVLQLALRHPGMTEHDTVSKFARELADNIESRLCKTPAMKEVARRGWNRDHDIR